MTERNQVGRSLRRHDAGKPRGLQRIALRDGASGGWRGWPRRSCALRRRRPPRERSPPCRRRPPCGRGRARRRATASRSALRAGIGFSSRARKNDRLSSDTVRSTFLSFTPGGTLRVPGEKFRIARTPACTAVLTTVCAESAGTATTAMSMCSRLHDLAELGDVEDADAAARAAPDLGALGVEERDDREPFLPESRVVGEREPEVAGAEDRHAHGAIEPQDHPQVALELLDVVADAADAELAEVGEVLANLRGVQMELLGQGLRGNASSRPRHRACSGTAGTRTAGRPSAPRLGRPANGACSVPSQAQDITTGATGATGPRNLTACHLHRLSICVSQFRFHHVPTRAIDAITIVVRETRRRNGRKEASR